MLSVENAIAAAILEIAKIFGKEYMRSMFKSAGYSYEPTSTDDSSLDYFCGFKSDTDNQWTEYAYVRVNRDTKEVALLDYRLPTGERMQSPLKPIGKFSAL